MSLLAWLMVPLAGACKGGAEPAPAPARDAAVVSTPKATPQSVVQAAPAPHVVETAPAPAEQGQDAAAGEPAPAEDAQAPAVGRDATASAQTVDAQAEPDTGPRPAEELCAKACAHALKLSLGELPKDARPGVRESLKRALERDCPRQCRERATPASAACVLQAKTARELADCPH